MAWPVVQNRGMHAFANLKVNVHFDYQQQMSGIFLVLCSLKKEHKCGEIPRVTDVFESVRETYSGTGGTIMRVHGEMLMGTRSVNRNE